MNVSNLFRALLTLTCITTVLNGCGGNGPTTPPIYAGDFTGGEVVLGSDRGGGPMIDIGSTTVQGSDGRFGTTVTLNIPAKVPIVGGIIGSISNDGLVTATVELTDGGTLSIGGGPLHWQDGRAGPSRLFSGSVAVIYPPAGGAPQVQYLGSNLQLWQ